MQLADIRIERKFCIQRGGAADGHGYAEQGIRTQSGVVFRAIEFDEQIINLLLRLRRFAF